MKKSMSVLVISVFSFFILVSLSSAQHMHGGMSGSSMKMDTKEVLVEGTKVTFQVMVNNEY